MAKRVLNKWRGYTVADCDCKYCLYYGGRKKGEVKCLADECVCKAELREAQGRKLVFDVIAYDDKGDVIGEGVIERFVVFAEKFMSKLS